MMLAWLIYYKESAIHNKHYIEFYIEEGHKLGITVKLILVEELDFGVQEGEWYIRVGGEVLSQPDFVICRAIYPLLSRQLEAMEIRVFNNALLSEICNDKAKTYQYLAKTSIRMVDTCFCKNSLLKAAMESISSPTVIKAADGHGGSQVFLVDTNMDEK